MSIVTVHPGETWLRLFGRFGLFAANGAEVTITSRRGRGLFAYLYLAADHEESREKLCSLFWGDRGDAQARASLRQCILELRDALASADLDILSSGREKVTLNAEAVTSDLAHLRRALAGDDSEATLLALSQIEAKDLLEDSDLPGQYQEWLQLTRPRLHQSIALGVHTQLERLELAGRWTEVIEVSEAYLRRDSLDETVAAAAIRADAATGNAAAAHRRFRILKEAMNREYGAAPGATAREALARAVATQASPPASLPQILPPDRLEIDAPPLVIVAVFETGQADGEPARLVSILRDEVLAGLARFRDLRVVADPRPIDHLSEPLPNDLGVAYILGASLRAGRDGGRLTARLIRTRDRFVIWSESLEVPGLDVVETIDSIIARVVGAVLPKIDSDLVRNASLLPSSPIYERYLVARDLAAKARTHEEALAAARDLESLVAAKPSFALPYLPLAFLYNTDFWYTRAGSSSPDLKERALELAKTALALDRAHVHGYTICGWSYLRRRQWEPAKMYLDQAFSLNPFHPRRVMEVGYAYLFLGDTKKARTLLNRHLLLNPDPDDFYYMDLGLLSFVEGDLEKAANYLELIANPDIWALLYRSITTRVGDPSFRLKVAAFRNRLAMIWPADSPMTPDAVVAWVASHHPFQSRETEDRFLAAVRYILTEA